MTTVGQYPTFVRWKPKLEDDSVPQESFRLVSFHDSAKFWLAIILSTCLKSLQWLIAQCIIPIAFILSYDKTVQ